MDIWTDASNIDTDWVREESEENTYDSRFLPYDSAEGSYDGEWDTTWTDVTPATTEWT